MVDFSQIYEDAGKQYNIDPMLLQSIARVESGEGKNTGPSSAGALGVMQFMPDTAKQYGVDVNDPKSSIFGAAHYMSDLLDQTKGDLPQALAIYNGSGSDRSQTYPKQILTNYQQVQTQRQADLRASGQVSEAQPEPGIIDVGTPPGPAQPNTSGRTGTAGPDVASTLFGKGASTAPAAPAAAPAGDVASTLFGAPAPAAPATNIPTVTVRPTPPAASPATPPAPAPAVAAAPAPAAPAVPPDVPVTPPAAAQTPAAPAPAVAAQPPPPTADMTPQAPVQTAEALAQPSWYQRNIGQPVAAMMDPTAPQPQQNYLLNSPTLQSLGSGVVQGTRDVAQTLAHAGEWVDARVPWMASLDRSMGYPEQSQLPAQTQAYNQQYGSDMAAGAGRLAGEIGTTYPVGWLARGAGAIAEAAPVVGRFLAPAFAGGVGGAAQNELVSGGTGQDWENALVTGGAGGTVLGGLFGAIGARFAARAQQRAEQQIADRLGIRLSVGQRAGQGSVAKRIEDTTSILPGSGAAKFAEEQREQIVRVIAREAGIGGPVRQIDTAMLNQAEDRAGQAIENAAQRITVPSNPRFMRDMAAIESAAQQAGTTTPQANTVRNLGSQLFTMMANNGGDLAGPDFQRFIARGGPLQTALTSSVPEVRAAGNAIREALLNAAQSSGRGSAEALRDLGRARYQYKVIQTVRPAITRTPSGSDEMSLPGLAQAIRNEFNMRMTGAGADMQDLSRLISGPLRTLPSSGTAERLAWQRWLGLGAEGAGLGTGGVAWALGHPGLAEGAITATGVPMAASLLAGRGLRYGAGLGINPLEAARLEFNPLLPRIMGPNVGNQLLLPAPQRQQ